jgi:large subunit ribosomal protein L28
VSRKCDICGKGPQFGHNISHAHNKTKRVWLPNIQNVKINVNGQSKRVKVCTQCIKSGKVQKAQ